MGILLPFLQSYQWLTNGYTASPAPVIPVTYKWVLWWLRGQASGVIVSVLELVGPVSEYCDWVKEWILSTSSFPVWLHVQLSQHIRPWGQLCALLGTLSNQQKQSSLLGVHESPIDSLLHENPIDSLLHENPIDIRQPAPRKPHRQPAPRKPHRQLAPRKPHRQLAPRKPHRH